MKHTRNYVLTFHEEIKLSVVARFSPLHITDVMSAYTEACQRFWVVLVGTSMFSNINFIVNGILLVSQL